MKWQPAFRTRLFTTAARPQVLLRGPEGEHPNPAPTGEPNLVDTSEPGVSRIEHQPGETGAEAPKARPEGLPEGFDSWEAYAKDLEGKSKPGEDTQNASEEDTTQTDTSEVQVKEALESLPEESREKAKPFFEEFAKTGALTQESKEAAAKAFGVSTEMVDMYIAGAQATEAGEGAQLLATAGVSKEDFDGFKAWAETNQTVAERVAFNEALDKDPSKTLQDAITAWKEAGNGPAPRDITRDAPGKKGDEPSAQGYASVAEMQRDMSDPKYAKDPAFRAEVEKKVGASSFSLGKDVGGI